MKKEVLFMMDSLTCGGAEKSLVSLLPLLDYDKVNVTLLLFARGGVFECYVPDQVKVVKLDLPSDMKMKMSLLWFSFQIRKNKLFGKKEHLAETYWKCVENSVPEFNKSYDIAIAYQQGFPTYYVANKVSATKKYAWVNVDLKKAGYSSDFNSKIYEKYDKVVAVSDAVSDYLVSQKYVTDTSKIVVVYDILNTELIRSMSKEQGFKDNYDGTRLVTVGRMVPQKAYDLAVLAADELKSRGYK
ncbi:MAG: glycosyltransferase, partial [Paludibacteraceae bacterium]|nr:glycosyltransferase [Paludibacteraceae bacterium]